MTLCSVKASVYCQADVLHKGLSDHAPVVVSFGDKKPIPSDEQPIPMDIVRSEAFDHHFRQCHDACHNPDDSPPEQLKALNCAIRTAAKLAREDLHTENEHTVFGQARSLSTFARCIWNNDVKTADKILSRSKFARELIKVENNVVQTIDEEHFEKTFWENKTLLFLFPRRLE